MLLIAAAFQLFQRRDFICCRFSSICFLTAGISTDASPRYKYLVGQRVSRIGAKSVEEVYTILHPFVGADNESTVKDRIPLYTASVFRRHWRYRHSNRPFVTGRFTRCFCFVHLLNQPGRLRRYAHLQQLNLSGGLVPVRTYIAGLCSQPSPLYPRLRLKRFCRASKERSCSDLSWGSYGGMATEGMARQ